jgi:AraC family transcriptional regulator
MGRIRKDTAPLARRYPRRHFQIFPDDWLTMDAGSVTEALERRFHTRAAHTVIAKVKPARQPVLFSYVASAVPIAEKTVAPPIEAAFAVHVHHQPLSAAETWIDNRHAKVPRIGTGGICIFDLQTAPVALIREPFAFSRFHITQAALDEVAYQSRVPRVQLRIPVFGRPDAVLYNLALALNARLAIYAEEKDSLFADYVALAFHEHVVRTYGDRALLKTWKGALSPRRLRAVMELMTEDLGESLSIKEIASHIDVAPSYFVRAFREAVGEPPHRWLMRKRIERAKSLLRSSEIAISDVSAICGFSDQSHFTRVFRQIEGITPYSWRRNCD